MSEVRVADTGLTWDELREMREEDQPIATMLSKEMYAANKVENILLREGLRRRLANMLRRARRL